MPKKKKKKKLHWIFLKREKIQKFDNIFYQLE